MPKASKPKNKARPFWPRLKGWWRRLKPVWRALIKALPVIGAITPVVKCRMDRDTDADKAFVMAMVDITSVDTAAQNRGVTWLEQQPSLRRSQKKRAHAALVGLLQRRRNVPRTAALLCRYGRVSPDDKRALKLIGVLGHDVSDNATALLNTDLEGADLDSASLIGANFRRTCLRGAHFRYAILDRAHFDSAQLDSAVLNYASVAHTVFSNDSLRGAHLDSIQGDQPEFFKADLTSAWLQWAAIPRSHFRGTVLTCAHLIHATLDGADFADAVIVHTDFGAATMFDVKHLDEVQDASYALFEATVGLDPSMLDKLRRTSVVAGTIGQPARAGAPVSTTAPAPPTCPS